MKLAKNRGSRPFKFRSQRAWAHARELMASLSAGAILVMMMTGCAIFEAPPPHQLDISNSKWTITTIDGQVLDTLPEANVSFDSPDVDEIVIDLGCDSVRGEFVMDTDGAALSFAHLVSDEAATCTGKALSEARMVIDAFSNVESWEVLSDHRIELEGKHAITLQR